MTTPVAKGRDAQAWPKLDREGFARDGVTCVRGIVTPDEIEILRAEVDAVIGGASDDYVTLKEHTKRNVGEKAEGRFVHAFNMWQKRARLGQFAQHSRLPELAAKLTEADKINLFFDQCFVKEPGTVDPTPWHADQPYWPIVGRQVVTIWVALDRVTRESGAVEFVAGSSNWGRWFQPRSFSGANELARNENFEEMPDIEGNRDKYNIVSWDLEPGDVLVFQGMTLHGAPGNLSSNRRRRGYALRYTGSDVAYDPRPGCTPTLLREDLAKGQPIDSACYPVVWDRRG